MSKPVPGTGGEIYVPFEKRTGESSVVYFTRDLSPEGLKKIYERACAPLSGKIAIKVHTGEAEGPNIIPLAWIRPLFEEKLPDATVVETNTYYDGTRYTTEAHRKTLEINGWNFCPVDITDENGVATLPVNGGKWFDEIHVGEGILKYDSMLTLSHFKGHVRGGFGGANKNIGIGCADGRIGKAEIHTAAGSSEQWSIGDEEFMERVTESTKAVLDFFENRVTYISVMRNMSVNCDCDGITAEPVVTPDIGILASTDILAVDSACVDMIYALPEGGGTALIQRIESRHGLRQLSYMKEIGLGNDRYKLIDMDNGDRETTAAEVTKDIRPEWNPDCFNIFFGRNKRRTE